VIVLSLIGCVLVRYFLLVVRLRGCAATWLQGLFLTNVYKGHEGLAEDVGEGERCADFEGH
jgi:hypothetical protein